MIYILVFILVTILVSHTGIAWAGILITPGNAFNFVKLWIDKIPSGYIQDLLTCAKCISGQVALWISVVLSVIHPVWPWYYWTIVGLLWIPTVIVVTDQLNRRYGYS